MRSMFIWPCYPCKVLEGGERGVSFVPQEPADGCNPLQNAHWKSVKTGWTWCMSVEEGDTSPRVGVSQKKPQVGSNKRLLVLSRQKRKVIVRRQRGSELQPPPKKGRSPAPCLRWTQLPCLHSIPGRTSPTGGTATKTSQHWHHSTIKLNIFTGAG